MGTRLVAVAIAGAAYVLGSQWLMTRAPASPWNAVVVVAPMLALAALLAWRRRRRVLALLAAAAAGALALQAWRGAGLAPATIYVGQHVAVHVLLAFVFGLTLQQGHEPLVTALARRVHGSLTPDMEAYSRKVTLAWTVYFLAMAALSLALFALAPFATWATFANLVTPLAIVAMFLGEHALRYRLHPEFERATLAQAMRAYADRAAPHE
jgi:MYXO-CTERM domain-containing protein